MLGSVAEKVLRWARCPVLTVRSGVRLARRTGSPFEHLVSNGFSTTATAAVSYARVWQRGAGCHTDLDECCRAAVRLGRDVRSAHSSVAASG